MLYYLFLYLEQKFNLTGASVFQYISFRASMSIIFSLLITIVFGSNLINMLKKFQMSETVRDLGLKGQKEKEGTPTMGGIIIIAAIVIPTLLFADICNIYIILLVASAIWMGLIGFLDDYIKVKLKNKEGLNGRFKILGQVLLGLVVGSVIVFHEDVILVRWINEHSNDFVKVKELFTTIPFIKNNEFNYSWLVPSSLDSFTWIMYIFIVVFIITAVSNGANITDGLDGLATGVSATIGLTLAIFAYLSGNMIFSKYLNILFIPDIGETVIFCTAFVGACIGFLWYNTYPAKVFMGDTGSLALGGIIAVMALLVRKELLIPVFCGIFLIENLSVIIQVCYFKYTKKKYGVGKRIFLMSPLHHHFQKKGIHEAQIVTRFWAISILLAILSLATLKLR